MLRMSLISRTSPSPTDGVARLLWCSASAAYHLLWFALPVAVGGGLLNIRRYCGRCWLRAAGGGQGVRCTNVRGACPLLYDANGVFFWARRNRLRHLGRRLAAGRTAAALMDASPEEKRRASSPSLPFPAVTMRGWRHMGNGSANGSFCKGDRAGTVCCCPTDGRRMKRRRNEGTYASRAYIKTRNDDAGGWATAQTFFICIQPACSLKPLSRRPLPARWRRPVCLTRTHAVGDAPWRQEGGRKARASALAYTLAGAGDGASCVNVPLSARFCWRRRRTGSRADTPLLMVRLRVPSPISVPPQKRRYSFLQDSLTIWPAPPICHLPLTGLWLLCRDHNSGLSLIWQAPAAGRAGGR